MENVKGKYKALALFLVPKELPVVISLQCRIEASCSSGRPATVTAVQRMFSDAQSIQPAPPSTPRLNSAPIDESWLGLDGDRERVPGCFAGNPIPWMDAGFPPFPFFLSFFFFF